ncbi:MAG TPA: SPFH domain-containing protein, partial [Vicinamibacterales bacterium]
MIRERKFDAVPGLPMLLLFLAALVLCVLGIFKGASDESALLVVASALGLLLTIFLSAGLFVVNPNEGRVLQLFGDYVGTAHVPGLRWANPFYTKKRISLRVRNFESARLKVNDNEGNPIEIAAVVVWQVVDTAEAVFQVDDYNNYVKVQSESALRNLATSYTYDTHDDAQMSLRSHTAAVA